MQRALRIFIADDYAIMRDGLRSSLKEESDLEFVGDADDAAKTVSKVSRLRPDVAVLDVCMPGTNGIEMTRLLKESIPRTKVLVLTPREDLQFMRDAIRAGAAGYVLRRSGPPELIRAIRAVADGGIYIDAAMAPQLVGNSSHDLNAFLEGPQLSAREEEVLRLIAQGYSNKEVAAKMNVSVKTVETYRARSLRKLRMRSRVEIVRYALQCGWLVES